ncbi:LytTR family DNA-binding domain-containing protein [Enterococcus durans]|uniref:LytR/AlgR family response regulator transcription factor n=1 Tax=Enterococcus durans TaxID=53345 RepID=UPI00288D4505|nr:LytTR family DNA-binding domain-containing protein [Enterococcus durans]MDT2836722.1 LytTR family DNA-binding domain-containing protein [Enterococcus durans]
MNIFVCDDEPVYLNKIVKVIHEYILFKDVGMTLKYSTTKPEELLTNFERDSETDSLFFLDVDLKTMIDGMDVAEKIKSINSSAKIVFITTHGELSSLVFKYQLEVLDYIEKSHLSVVEERVKACIDKASERFLQQRLTEEAIILKIENKVEKIPLNQVMFFESSAKSHCLEAHFNNRQFEFYGKLADLMDLSPTLMKSHKSYVVNIKNVVSVDVAKRTLTFVNGESCYLSFRFQKNILNQFKSHL